MWNFPSGSDYLAFLSGPVNEPPCTFAAWVKGIRPTPAPQTIICVADGGAESNLLELVAVKSGLKYKFGAKEGTSQATTSATFTRQTVLHVCGVFASHSSRTIYVNGANAVTQGSTEASAGGNSTRVARNPATTRRYLGAIGEVALWDAALNADEVDSLYRGVPAYRVRQKNLQMFLPLRWAVGSKAFDFSQFVSRDMTIVGTPTFNSAETNVAEPWGIGVPMPVAVAGGVQADRVCHQGLELVPAVEHQGLGFA